MFNGTDDAARRSCEARLYFSSSGRLAANLLKLIQPSILANGKRIPGLKLDHPRQLALLQALVRFSHIAAQDSLSTAEVHADTADALGLTTTDYSLASLRYDLSKLRAKGLVERLHKCRRYRLTSEGYRFCVVYLKLFERLYAPRINGILKPFKDDAQRHGAGGPQAKSAKEIRQFLDTLPASIRRTTKFSTSAPSPNNALVDCVIILFQECLFCGEIEKAVQATAVARFRF